MGSHCSKIAKEKSCRQYYRLNIDISTHVAPHHVKWIKCDSSPTHSQFDMIRWAFEIRHQWTRSFLKTGERCCAQTLGSAVEGVDQRIRTGILHMTISPLTLRFAMVQIKTLTRKKSRELWQLQSCAQRNQSTKSSRKVNPYKIQVFYG